MSSSDQNRGDNVIALNLSKFTEADIMAIKSLGEKQKLLYRWFRCERETEPGLDKYMIYSGARTKTPYAAYRVERHRDGTYKLLHQRTDEEIVSGRTIGDVLLKIPDDFFYSV